MRHSCCRREKSDRDALQRKGCCDNDCVIRQSENLPQDRTNSGTEITLRAVAEPSAVTLDCFAPFVVQDTRAAVDPVDYRLKYSRPPELYLRHHAFLI